MQTLILMTWLAAAPAASDTSIVVQTHALASPTATKAPRKNVADRVSAPVLGVGAKVDAQGLVHYQCEGIGTRQDLREVHHDDQPEQ